MSYTDGNLALNKKRWPVTSQPEQRSPQLKTRRIPVTATPTHEALVARRMQAIRRELARRRLRLMAMMVGLVLSVSAVFGVIVYRQARILEMNFTAVAMEQQISQYNKESSQIRESLAQKTNLDQIRQQAISRLGLQDPARSQVIKVYVPDTDRVVYTSPGSALADDEAYLTGAFSAIEAYFKTLRVNLEE